MSMFKFMPLIILVFFAGCGGGSSSSGGSDTTKTSAPVACMSQNNDVVLTNTCPWPVNLSYTKDIAGQAEPDEPVVLLQVNESFTLPDRFSVWRACKAPAVSSKVHGAIKNIVCVSP